MLIPLIERSSLVTHRSSSARPLINAPHQNPLTAHALSSYLPVRSSISTSSDGTPPLTPWDPTPHTSHMVTWQVQHIYQQRWRGSTGLVSRVHWKKRLLCRLLLPVYCLAATLYPPLDPTRIAPPQLYPYLVPSPRLKFAIHSIADLVLACCLVLAHMYFGSMRRLLHPEGREEINGHLAFVSYVLLATWVLVIIMSELLHTWRASEREYVTLLDS